MCRVRDDVSGNAGAWIEARQGLGFLPGPGGGGRPPVYSFSMKTDAANYKFLPLCEPIQLVLEICDSIAEDRVELQRRMEAQEGDPSSGIPREQVGVALYRGPS